MIREIEGALGSGFAVIGAETYEQAVAHLATGKVDLLVLCYVFDENRPYRLLNHVKASDDARLPVVLVRALPVPLQDTEEQIRQAYALLGVDAFFNVSDDAARGGRPAALHRLTEWVADRLPR